MADVGFVHRRPDLDAGLAQANFDVIERPTLGLYTHRIVERHLSFGIVGEHEDPVDPHLSRLSRARIVEIQAQAVAREVQVKLTPQEQVHIAQVRRVEPDAYEAYVNREWTVGPA